MAEITAALVKQLRDKTGAGMMDAKKALVENNGDIEASADLLREKGILKAAKKADRIAAEGLVGVAAVVFGDEAHLLAEQAFMLAIAKAPGLVLVQVVAGAAILGSTVFMHLLTLPVEMDASFRRALPLLKEGRYLDDKDLPAARSILRAAAFTYVAAAAYTLLDVAQWARIILRR